MSKSLGNAYTIADIKRRATPLAFRYMPECELQKQAQFAWDGIKAAQVALDRLFEVCWLIKTHLRV